MNSVHNHPADEPRRADQPSTMIPHSMPSLGAEAAHQQALSLPIYPKLHDDDLQYVIQEVLACSDHCI